MSTWSSRKDKYPKQSKLSDKLLIFGFFAIVLVIVFAMITTIVNVVVNGFKEIDFGVAKKTISTVPWDYKIENATVGELVDGDMILEPDNILLPNVNHYAKGDKIWTLKYMTADMQSDGKKNDIKLSIWEPIKTYSSKQAAERDLKELKVKLQAEVDLVGVYKTEYQGKYRQFAIIKLPSGHVVKQPIDEPRYIELKEKKKVTVLLEEVHDFLDYDLAMAKFRGWPK